MHVSSFKTNAACDKFSMGDLWIDEFDDKSTIFISSSDVCFNPPLLLITSVLQSKNLNFARGLRMVLLTPLISHHALFLLSFWLVFDSNSHMIIATSFNEVTFNRVELIFLKTDEFCCLFHCFWNFIVPSAPWSPMWSVAD